MADVKISSLSELTTVSSDDELVVVDKSDTTQAATGTTKKVQVVEAIQDIIHGATEKTTPADNDELALLDSAASYVLKRLSFLNLKYAVGSYLNPVGTIREFNVATNPATLLGFGTWSAFGTGRVTVAIDAGQTEFDTNGETGGAKTHTLTPTEMPAHNHKEIVYNGGLGEGGKYLGADPQGLNVTGDSGVVTGNAGGSGDHNNLQPYIVVYRWVRTA